MIRPPTDKFVGHWNVFIVQNTARKGLTLVELIVVVAIFAILTAVAVPVFTNLTNKAKQGADIASATEIANAINLYNTASPDVKITQSDVDKWSTEADVKAKLQGLTPVLNPDNFAEAIDRVTVSEKGVATVTTDID